MEKIEGIDLSEEVKLAADEIFKLERIRIREKIKQVMGQLTSGAGTVKRLREELSRAEAALARHQETLKALESNDWRRLSDDKPQKAPEQA